MKEDGKKNNDLLRTYKGRYTGTRDMLHFACLKAVIGWKPASKSIITENFQTRYAIITIIQGHAPAMEKKFKECCRLNPST